MLQFIVPESQQIFFLTGFASFIVSIIIGIVMYYKKDSSVVAETYIIGAVLTFIVGGFLVPFSPVFPMCPCEVSWRSPIGLIGGWLLILLAFIEYRSSRMNTSSSTESKSE